MSVEYSLTPGAQRALAAAAAWTVGNDYDPPEAPAVLLGLLAESECRAALILARHGIHAPDVRCRWPRLVERGSPPHGAADWGREWHHPSEGLIQAICGRLADWPRPTVLATEHLLLGLTIAGDQVSAWLCERGLDADRLQAEIGQVYGHTAEPLPYGEDEEDEPADTAAVRVIDAAANRAREGLRVVEDYVRFVLDDRHLTEQLKRLRHDLAAELERAPIASRLAARETQADVGTAISTASEQLRGSTASVVIANFLRLQEALRSLEEFGKLIDAEMAQGIEQIRYRSYTLQRAVEITRSSLERLSGARLYVLIDGRDSAEEFARLARSLVAAGVDILQLRDKRLDDRRLLERARLLREITRGGRTLFIMNDRPDLGALSRADGVHVGQEELSVKDARTIVGPGALIGVSTHSIEQARQAVLDGANYIGVGPTFPSGTKPFEHFPGIELLRSVAAEIRLPAFAIGGITRERLPEVLAAGFRRIAVSGAIFSGPDPVGAVRELQEGILTEK